MSLQAQAFWVAEPGRGELRSEALERPGPDQVLVRALFSGISRGTESLVFAGRVPQSESARMRCPFQQGDFPGPVKYGYASVGEILEGPDDLLGEIVFCLFPHQDLYLVPASAAVVLPQGLPPERAVLAANMETALNGLWDSDIGAGDRVCVVGAGVVGALLAWLAVKIPGTEVCLVDINAKRRALAEALGVRFAGPDDAPDEQDVVIHASGSEAGLVHSLALAGQEALVLEMSWFGQSRPSLPLGEAFHSRRLSLRASQVGRIPSSHQARWDHRRRLAKALELLQDPALDALISGESGFSELPAVMMRLTAADQDALCHRIRYG